MYEYSMHFKIFDTTKQKNKKKIKLDFLLDYSVHIVLSLTFSILAEQPRNARDAPKKKNKQTNKKKQGHFNQVSLLTVNANRMLSLGKHALHRDTCSHQFH